MRDLRAVKLALGIAPVRDLDAVAVEALGTLAFDLSQVFHGSSSTFWKRDPSPVRARVQLLRAAAFEDFRSHWDWFALAVDPSALSVARLAALVSRLESQGGDVLVSVRPTQGDDAGAFEIVTLRKRCITALLADAPSEQVFGPLDGCEPDLALLERLANLGFKIERESETACIAAPESSAHQPYRLPRDVHFLPTSAAAGCEVASLAEIATPLRTALRSLRHLSGSGRIAIYGAGQIAEEIIPLLGERVAFALDRNTDLHAKPFHGVAVHPPEVLLERLEEVDAVLITALGRESEITATLAEMLGSHADSLRIFALDGSCSGGGDDPADEERERLAGRDQELAIAEGDAFHPAPIDPTRTLPPRPETTTERSVTKRAVLYVGYPCNIRCIFCYYTYVMDGAKWHPLSECIRDADVYRNRYGNACVDITGGEPTAYPRIVPLLEHCSQIGLRPTLITNMRMLAKLDHAKKLRDAGVYDFLCSLHALGSTYDFVTQTRNAWEKLTRGLDNINKLGIPWRTNCTLTLRNMRQIKKIAQFSYLNGSRVINFINYNPFYQWQTKMDIDFQARHTEMEPFLLEALAYCDEVGLEANVRYFPLCMMKGHEEKAYNYAQLTYDPHEWDYNSWYSDQVGNPSAKYPTWLPALEPDAHALHEFLARRTREGSYVSCTACSTCSLRALCDGLTRQYAERFGTGEVRPYGGSPVTDVTHFIRRQQKIIDR